MNLFKKIYCRAFQLGFRVAIPILPYREPQIITDISETGKILKSKGKTSTLIVTDSFLYRAGMTAGLEKSLKDAGISFYVYDKTSPNPTSINVEEALSLYNKNNCDSLIGFGGGSSIDCAKAVGARAAYPRKSVRQLQGILKVLKPLPLLIAVPTTAGTGSEATLASLITESDTRHKCSINSFPLIPSYAVHDPSLTYSLPKMLTATTGMDALTHAVEAYIGRSTTRETRTLALEAVRLIFNNLETAYNDGGNKTARANMLSASYKAGRAFTISYVGYIHAVAHTLGGEYNVPHGLANSILMPVVLEDYGECIHGKLHDLAVAAGIADQSNDPADSARKFIAEIRAMNKRMGIPEKVSVIRKSDISKLAAYADREANPLYPVPKLMDASALQKYYFMISDSFTDERI